MTSSVVQPRLAEAVMALDRHTRWTVIDRIRLPFPTHHPQGLAVVGERTFLSSVEVSEAPENSGDPGDPGGRSAGAGRGHVLVLDSEGERTHDIPLGGDTIYHPGGIDADGTDIWIPVAEYRPQGRSIVVTVDAVTLTVRERFAVPDHVGWVVRDPERDVVYGGSWGSRRIFTWSPDGRLIDTWVNPTHFIDYQDCQLVAPGLVLCSGIAHSAGRDGSEVELGGIALIDITSRRILTELPIPLFSAAGHVVNRNPFTARITTAGLKLTVAPDDGDESDGTELLTLVPV